jgi:hypothetical protein
VDTEPGHEGFLEDGWLNDTIEAGKHVQLVHMRPTLRCVMAAHRQADLLQDLRTHLAAAQHHGNHIDVWPSIGTSGRVHIGNPVVLVK